MADHKDKSAGETGAGFGRTAVILASLTLLGGGAGATLGVFALTSDAVDRKAGNQPPPVKSSDEHGHKNDPHAGPSGSESATFVVKELPAIVANLAAPERSWIRLQSAIVYDPTALPHADEFVVNLLSDVTAFLRTLTLAEIEGPDGLRRLQEDLNARAATRSQKRLKEFVIESLVVQ